MTRHRLPLPPPPLQLLLLLACALVAADPPTQVLTHGDLSITVALPDHEHGHYQGKRFDHGGIVTDATWHGHTFLGLLKPPHNPTAHDGAAGTPEEFNIELPPGFAAAADGESFLKIGVGALTRPDRKSYKFSVSYPVAQWATWQVETADDHVTCRHEEAAGAYAVKGSKTIRLLPDGDGFTIERELTSTGTAELPVEHYNHTMVIIDGKPIDDGYTLTYPAPVTVTHKLLKADGPVVGFTIPLQKGSVWTQVKGLPDDATAASVIIAKDGVALTLSGDTAPAKVVIYAEKTAICPEVFTAFTLAPGESKRWSQTYRFSAATVRP